MNSDLNELRKEIDRIDSEMVRLLGKRFAVTREVGILKTEHKLDSVAPDREKEQFLRLEKLCEEYGAPADVAIPMLRMIIDKVVKTHEEIKANSLK